VDEVSWSSRRPTEEMEKHDRRLTQEEHFYSSYGHASRYPHTLSFYLHCVVLSVEKYYLSVKAYGFELIMTWTLGEMGRCNMLFIFAMLNYNGAFLKKHLCIRIFKIS
jgi:hypothetical protein